MAIYRSTVHKPDALPKGRILLKLIHFGEGNTDTISYSRQQDDLLGIQIRMTVVGWIELDLYTSGVLHIGTENSDVVEFFEAYLDGEDAPLLWA